MVSWERPRDASALRGRLYARVLLASGVLAGSDSEFRAETRTTTREHGEPRSGSRSMRRRTAALHPQSQILYWSGGEILSPGQFSAFSGSCPRSPRETQVQIPRRQRMTIPRLDSLARNLRSLGTTEAVPHFPLPHSLIPSFPHFGVLSGDPTHERGSSVGWFVGGVSTSRRLGRTGPAAEDGTPA